MKPAKLAALIGRSGKPIFTSPSDLAFATRGLVSLSSYFKEPIDLRRLLAPVRKYARRDLGVLTALLSDREVIDFFDEAGGRRLTFVLRALPNARDTNTLAAYRSAADLLTAAMGEERMTWPLADLRAALTSIRHHGGYDATLVAALVGMVRKRLPGVSAADAVELLAITTLLPEVYTREKALLEQMTARVALVADDLSPAMVGTVCGCLNRIQYRSSAVALALQEEADRVAQGCDTRTCVEFLLFTCRQEASCISTDSVQWLFERLIGETLDATAMLHLCRAIRSLPLHLKEQLRQDVIDVVGFASGQMIHLLRRPAAEGGLTDVSLSLESAQLLMSSFLCLHKAIVPACDDLSAVEGYTAAVDACADFVSEQVERLMNDSESAPFSLVSALLEAPTAKAKEGGARLLSEFATECVHMPALQTFRFLLLLGDNGVQDRAVLRYLRGSFCKTATDIPPAQLCTALRCFIAGGLLAPPTATPVGAGGENSERKPEGSVSGTPSLSLSDEIAAEMEREKYRAFFRLVTETVRKWFADGLSLRLAIALTDALYTLGCRDEAFYSDMAAYLDTRRTTAAPHMHACESAEVVCLAFGEDTLDRYPELHTFLLEVQARGTRDGVQLRPSAWMALHDPANALVPLTEQQQEGWNIMEAMVATRADDRESLVALGQAYVKLLPFTRPDDIKYFFGVCEEKVLKEDRFLRECLEQLGTTGVTSRLSANTIGAILHSLASLRFAYPRCTRRFVEGISDEQWREMEVAPMAQILSAMSRLSLRMPRQLGMIGERLTVSGRFLSPQDIAGAIRSFQTLGFQDEAVLQALMANAAAAVQRFDDISMTTLFSAPAVHRLLRTPDVAVPLLQRACQVVTSPHTRVKIATKLRRAGMPRDLLESCTAELSLLSGAEATPATLRLT